MDKQRLDLFKNATEFYSEIEQSEDGAIIYHLLCLMISGWMRENVVLNDLNLKRIGLVHLEDGAIIYHLLCLMISVWMRENAVINNMN